MFGCFYFCKAWMFGKTYKKYFEFFTTSNFRAAGLLYKSMPGLCLIMSRAAKYLPNPALNNIPSLCENVFVMSVGCVGTPSFLANLA